MKPASLKERAALVRAETVGQAETTREQVWHSNGLRERIRAVAVAGLPQERASDPIASFTDAERAHIRAAIGVHMSRMEVAAQCFAASNTNRAGYLH